MKWNEIICRSLALLWHLKLLRVDIIISWGFVIGKIVYYPKDFISSYMATKHTILARIWEKNFWIQIVETNEMTVPKSDQHYKNIYVNKTKTPKFLSFSDKKRSEPGSVPVWKMFKDALEYDQNVSVILNLQDYYTNTGTNWKFIHCTVSTYRICL